MKLLILAANGQIAQLVENEILSNEKFADVQLTLGLRNSQRLTKFAESESKILKIRLSKTHGDSISWWTKLRRVAQWRRFCGVRISKIILREMLCKIS